MDVMLARPFVIPISSPAKLGERSRWFVRKPTYTPALRAPERVRRMTAWVDVLANDSPTRAAAAPQ